jgi:hypothetical protein
MKRRTFFKRIGSILAVLGVAETEWLSLGDRYYQVLAQPTPHKLALLIGINKYQKSPSLSGCLTDVELQRELLMHRFGFKAADILTLTEEQADKKSIETAFVEHLGKQAKSGDVVVFHFSGYGTRIKSAELADTVLNALVLAKEYRIQDEKIVNYLWEENLLLLLRSLPTDRVTAVLDTSYYTPTKVQPTGWGIRARPELVATQLAAAELDFLQQLKNQTALKTQNPELNNIAVLSATSDPQQSARELLFSGFSAGLFTYALTQYLWEITPAKTIQFSLSPVGRSIHQLGSKQQPGLLNSKNNKALTIGNFLPDGLMGAEAAIIGIEEDGKNAELWLGGIPLQVLEYYGANSRFTLPTGEQLVLRSRSGLTAKAPIAKFEGTNLLKVGQLLQEAVRVLPRNINLNVALDTGLERIERVDATSAFAGVDHISTVMAGEQPADYMFGKLLQTPSRYELFSLDGEVIANTTGEVGEAVKVAVVQRLATKFPTLLAAKLWRLTENEGSSRLAVKATLEIINSISSRVVIKRETLRTLSLEKSNSKSLTTQTSALSTPIVPIGSRIQYRVQNQGDRPLYFMLLGLKNNRTAISFYPWQTPEEPNIAETQPMLKPVVIAPGETITVPQVAAAPGLMVSGPASEYEYQLILSTAPFSKTLEALETAKYPIADRQFINTLVNPLEVAQALLQDLHNTSTIKAEMNGTTSESYVLDVNNWASFNFSFQVS